MSTLEADERSKHRGRIPVSNAHTLYGIADETGVLKENEAFICVQLPGGRKDIPAGKVMVTRSPALHPGDVQFAHAVMVPRTSPLRQLHNCIVFSQHGERDLPSKLSGGDLDGDMYNVVFDESLWPKNMQTPAVGTASSPLISVADMCLGLLTTDASRHWSTCQRTRHAEVLHRLHPV